MRHKNEINFEDILSDKSIEDSFLEIPLGGKVFKIFFAVTVVIFLIITFQLFNLGVFHHQLYERIAFGNITESDIEPAPRGVIKDRFGNIIIDNQASFHVFLSPRSFPKSSEKREEILVKVSEILNIDPQKTLEEIENYDWRLGNFILKRNITHEELINLSSKDILGLEIESGFTRIASSPKTFSHLVGIVGLATKEDIKENPDFVLKNEIGKSGLELEYDEILRGQSGKEIAYINAHMEIEEKKVLSGPEMGESLELFIDAELQNYFYNRLLSQVENIGGKGGVGIVINPQNGEVLSLVSIPGFEINNPAVYLDKPNTPFFNRAINGLYNPGSTIKPLHAIAALEEKIVKPEKSFLSTGQLVLPNPYNPDKPSIFKDWKAHGWVDLYSALARSSNVYFYTIGGGFGDQEGLGIKRLGDWWKKFYLDKKTGIDLPGENFGLMPNPEEKENKSGENWRIGDTYNVSIGQGDLLVTPLELINYISAIANGGKIYRLRVAKRQKEEILEDISKEIEEALPHVRKGMKDAVDKSYGTAYYLSNLPFEVAAKTGSSEIGNKKTNALFVGFAPYKNPQIALLVLIEDAAEGGLNAVPVANDIFSWYYSHREFK